MVGLMNTKSRTAKREAGWAAVGNMAKAEAAFEAWTSSPTEWLDTATLILARDYAAVTGQKREVKKINAALRAKIAGIVGGAK